MRLSIQAARDDAAQKRLISAVTELSERFGLDCPAMAVQARDPDVKAMIQRERIADFLEAMVGATAPKLAPKRRKASTKKTT